MMGRLLKGLTQADAWLAALALVVLLEAVLSLLKVFVLRLRNRVVHVGR